MAHVAEQALVVLEDLLRLWSAFSSPFSYEPPEAVFCDEPFVLHEMDSEEIHPLYAAVGWGR